MAALHSQDVPPITVLSDQLRLLLRSGHSPGRMSVMLVDVPPGGGVPPHSHEREEEGYFVLEGELALMIDGVIHRLGAQGFGHVPPGTVHGYANDGAAPVRFLAWTIGGPIDEFFTEMSRRVRRMPEDAPAMAELTARYGISMAPTPPAE
jgi:quercetin dioxygenase-like cupin family protein